MQKHAGIFFDLVQPDAARDWVALFFDSAGKLKKSAFYIEVSRGCHLIISRDFCGTVP